MIKIENSALLANSLKELLYGCSLLFRMQA
jgi:hypothetical protein